MKDKDISSSADPHDNDADDISIRLASRRRPVYPHTAKSRIQTVLSAVLILVFLAFYKRRYPQELPDTWALCSRPPKSLIYTVDERNALVECLVTHKDVIVDTGTLADIRRRWGQKDTLGPPSTIFSTSKGSPNVPKEGLKVIFLKDGEAAYPGFHDAHAHVLQYGQSKEISLIGSTSVQDVVNRLCTYIRAHPALLNDTTQWIEAHGWDQTKWSPADFPSARDLEAEPLLRGRPIVLARIDVHAVWVSRTVLGLLGDVPHRVEGGVIVRDGQGDPTGVFIDNAQNLILDIKPEWTTKQMVGYFSAAMRDALSLGLTSIHDAATYPFMIDFFRLAADKGLLPIRLYLLGHVDGSRYWGSNITKPFSHPSGRLALRGVKLFADGALGSWGAALFDDYSDKPGERGVMVLQAVMLKEWVSAFVADGWQVAIHSIGDLANNHTLSVLSKHPIELRHRIEHAQVLTLSDLVDRNSWKHVIASVQPRHATVDMWWAEDRLGSARLKTSYAYNTLASSGAILALGSDSPVEPLNPLLGFYAAVTRLDEKGNSPHGPDGWYPNEKLSRTAALKGMTLNAAYASFQESLLGSLETGKKSDIVILDKDIMRVEEKVILEARVRGVIIDGRIAWGTV